MKAGSLGVAVSNGFLAAASASCTSQSRLKGCVLVPRRAARASGKPKAAASASAADPDKTCLRVLLTITRARPVLVLGLCAGTSPSTPARGRKHVPAKDQEARWSILHSVCCTANSRFRDAASVPPHASVGAGDPRSGHIPA